MKFTKLIAMVLADVMLFTLTFTAASAESGSSCEQQASRFEQMKNSTIQVNIYDEGAFHLKASKFYVREVTGVNPDGSFILSPWKCVRTSAGSFTLSGTCVQFAYSVDITWGTDWPYSGIFWSDTSTPVNNISITVGGMVRTVEIVINENNSRVYYCHNSSSHSEWKP